MVEFMVEFMDWEPISVIPANLLRKPLEMCCRRTGFLPQSGTGMTGGSSGSPFQMTPVPFREKVGGRFYAFSVSPMRHERLGSGSHPRITDCNLYAVP